MGEDEEVGEFLVPAPMEITDEDREKAENVSIVEVASVWQNRQ
jgi:hypothetical protein